MVSASEVIAVLIVFIALVVINFGHLWIAPTQEDLVDEDQDDQAV